MSRKHLFIAGPCVAALLICASPLLAGQETAITQLAERIATLRGELDHEEYELVRTRREVDTELASLSQERDVLRRQADQAQARVTSLRDVVRARRAILEARTRQQGHIHDVLLEACQGMEQSILQTAPLHREARIKRVAQLHDRIEAHAVTDAEGFEDLAALVRDEIELTGTTQLTKTLITLDGKERLVSVVALGTALLFWELEDGRAGVISHRNGQWDNHLVDAPEQRDAIHALYQAQKASIQATVLRLPLPPASKRDTHKGSK